LKNSRVPDRAMVPILAMTSSRDMPMPLSVTVIVRASCRNQRGFSGLQRFRAVPYASAPRKRSLSQASDALENIRAGKISLLLYKEWIMRSSSCLTSA